MFLAASNLARRAAVASLARPIPLPQFAQRPHPLPINLSESPPSRLLAARPFSGANRVAGGRVKDKESGGSETRGTGKRRSRMPKAARAKRSRPSGSDPSPYASAREIASKHASAAGGGDGSSAGLNLIAPNTNLGQHFLKNPAVVTAIVAKAGVKPTDVVLEIGPGTGNMTVPLCDQSKKVIAIEYDNRMVREVLKRVEGTPNERKLTVMQGDAIKTAWPFFDLCVANVPYQISSPLVFKLLAHRPSFRCAVMMFQEEFALRLTARPGEALYCRLSVNTQLLAKVDQLMKVGRNNFRPPPKVESRVVRIEPRNPPPPVDFAEWDGMVRLLFNRKNKTMRAVLMVKTTIKMLEENMRTHAALNGTMLDENVNVQDIIEEVVGQKSERWKGARAAKLDLDDFLQLLAEFNKRGIHFT